MLSSAFGIRVGSTPVFQLFAGSCCGGRKVFFGWSAQVSLLALGLLSGLRAIFSLLPGQGAGCAAAFLFVTLVAAWIVKAIMGSVRAVFLPSERTE